MTKLKAQDTIFADPEKLDSLKVLVYKRSHDDEEKVRLLNEFARMSFYNGKLKQGFTATIDAQELSKEIDFKEGQIMYHETLACFFGPSDIASYHHQMARMLSTQLNQDNSFSEVHTPEGYPAEPNEDYFKKILAVKEHFKDVKNREIIAVITDNIGYYYYTINDADNFNISARSIIDIYSDMGEFYPMFLYYSYLGFVAVEENDTVGKVVVEREINELVESIRNKKEAGPLNFQLANYYRINGQNTIAIEHYLECIDFFESIKDYFMLADVYAQMYQLYTNLEMFDKGSEAMKRRIELLETHNLQANMFSEYNRGMWSMYDAKNYEMAKYYNKLKKSVMTEQTAEHFMADSYSLEGHIYLDKKEYQEAIPLLKKAYEISIRLEREDNDEWEAYRIAYGYYYLKEYQEALKYGLLSQEVLAESNPRLKKKLNLLLFDIYDALGNEKLAYNHLKIYMELIKESENVDIANVLMRAEVRSVIEKNQKEIGILEKEQLIKEQQNKNQRLWILSIGGALLFVLILVLILYRNNKQKQTANSLLSKQKEEIQETLEQLKSAQAQLVQSEKMASLGELTAGIAHEIQNPLNFVKNFSEVSTELIDEMIDDLKEGKQEEVVTLANEIKENQERINHHGKRAGSIVRGMLQHSRSSSGEKLATDINALSDEYLRLSYHGLRAKDKTFNADLKTNLDKKIPKIDIIPQDFGRVLLNLINNAFYAVKEKSEAGIDNYKPAVEVRTKLSKGRIEIKVSDNGNGVPEAVKEKIFQPFFTTKPTGKGTGLGLSLSYDIVKAHGGTLRIESKEGQGATFIIDLPGPTSAA